MALIDKLSAIGDAIREKTGKEDLLTLDQMPTEIQAIETGGGDLPEEAFVITGDCNYRFAHDGWNWFIDNYSNKIITKDINDMANMFEFNLRDEIPFDLNGEENITVSLNYMFRYCNYLTSVPKMNKIKVQTSSYMFANCYRLKEIPDDIDVNWDWSYVENNSANRSYMFQNCYSLRKYPNTFLNHGSSATSYSLSMYNNLFYSCCSLDEIIDLPIPYTGTWANSCLSSTVRYCNRLKNFTFATQEDGTPYQRNWRNQTFDLTVYTGWCDNKVNILDYNSGITEDTRIVDDESYQLLKDHPDSWTTDVAYSRYNHDSAVATINSLPDCSSASGTNIIKFKGPAGSKTDGGAINTLTAEEIAVATAKKWTISYVN